MWSNVKFCETLKFCGAELQIIYLTLYVVFIKQVKRDHFGNFSQYNLLLNPWLCTATRVFCRRISSFYPYVSSGNRKWLLYDSHTEFLLTSRQFSLSRVVLLSTKDPLSVDISFKMLLSSTELDLIISPAFSAVVMRKIRGKRVSDTV